ncbi:hypothetical protein GY45DRAFT_845102 [Cubamyces sp. BRFM 1775]|nr:hypothetical protein GY45DRAFT_845102 [Cubamyces sp. BRFM 1775]
MFCTIPEEIQVKTLLVLEIGDILTCRLLCRQTRDIIDGSIELQYRKELAAAGMVDTTKASYMPLRERLQRLRTYEKAYRSAPLSYRPMLASVDPDDYEVWWNSTGGMVPYTAKDILYTWRPPSINRGVSEGTWSYGPNVVDTKAVDWVAIDLAQDLMVTLQWIDDDDHKTLECRLLSVSLKGAPHPLAARSFFFLAAEALQGSAHVHVQILGDLIGYAIHGPIQSLLVSNWKTDYVVWRYNYFGWARAYFYLLDASTIFLIEGYSMRLHTFDATRRAFDNLSMHSGIDYCELELPPLLDGAKPFIHSADAQIHPASYPDCNPVFSADPAQAVIAVSYTIRKSPAATHLLMLVPVDTLRKQFAYAKEERKQNGNARVVIPWDVWGPDGVRCILLTDMPSRLSVVGSRCAIWMRWQAWRDDSTDGTADVLIFEARPWVHLAAGSPQAVGRDPALEKYLVDQASYGQHSLFASPLRANLPYRLTHRHFYFGRVVLTASMFLLEDGLAVALRPDRLPPLDNEPDNSEPSAGEPAGFDLLLT